VGLAIVQVTFVGGDVVCDMLIIGGIKRWGLCGCGRRRRSSSSSLDIGCHIEGRRKDGDDGRKARIGRP